MGKEIMGPLKAHTGLHLTGGGSPLKMEGEGDLPVLHWGGGTPSDR